MFFEGFGSPAKELEGLFSTSTTSSFLIHNIIIKKDGDEMVILNQIFNFR